MKVLEAHDTLFNMASHTYHEYLLISPSRLRVSLTCDVRYGILIDDKNGSVIRKNRPLTLWDQRVMTHNNQFTELQNAQDKWGRSAAFCSKPKKSNGERGAEDQEEETFYISNHSGDNQSQWGNTSNSNSSNTSSISAGGECAERLLKQFLDSHYKLDANDERYSRQRQRKNVPTTSSSSSYNFLHIIQQYERNGACIASSLL